MPASSHSGRDSSLRIRVAPEEVAYRHWPLRNSGLGPWLTLAIVAGVSVLTGWQTGSVAMGLLTLAAFATITWRTWLPIWVEIGPSGITQHALGLRWRTPWTRVRHYQVGLHGVLLYADQSLTRLSPLRGVYLHWGKHRAAVLANFEYYLYAWTVDRGTGNDTTQLMTGGE